MKEQIDKMAEENVRPFTIEAESQTFYLTYDFRRIYKQGIIDTLAKLDIDTDKIDKWVINSYTSPLGDTGDYVTTYWLQRTGYPNIHIDSEDEEDYIEMADKLNFVDEEAKQQILNSIKLKV